MVPDPRAPLGPRAHRILNGPAPILVDADTAGHPCAVRRHGWHRSRAVAHVQDRWRIDDEWWRDRPISRLYYALVLDDGTFLMVYHDLTDTTWSEQRDPIEHPAR